MTTTALRVELLIIGFQGSIWAFFAAGLSLESVLADLSRWKDFSAPATLLLLGWCYSFGAAIDGVTGALEDPKSLFDKESEPPTSATMRLKFPDAYQELVRTDFDLRLLRATAANLLAFAFTAYFVELPGGTWSSLIITTPKLPGLTALVPLVVGLLLVGAWLRRRRRINLRRKALYDKAGELS